MTKDKSTSNNEIARKSKYLCLG